MRIDGSCLGSRGSACEVRRLMEAGALRTATLLAPELSQPRLLYGVYLAREGLHEQALTQLRRAKELAPDDPPIHMELGVALALAGDHSRAVDALAQAVSRDPQDGWGRILLGLGLLEDGRLEEAAGDWPQGPGSVPTTWKRSSWRCWPPVLFADAS